MCKKAEWWSVKMKIKQRYNIAKSVHKSKKNLPHCCLHSCLHCKRNIAMYPPWAKTINVFRACLGAQLTICAQKWRNYVLFTMVSFRFVLSRVCVFIYSLGPLVTYLICKNVFVTFQGLDESSLVTYAHRGLGYLCTVIHTSWNCDTVWCITKDNACILHDSH